MQKTLLLSFVLLAALLFSGCPQSNPPSDAPVSAAALVVSGKYSKPNQVTVIEFSDIQCPFCSKVHPSIERIRTTYGDKVNVVFKHFPLDSAYNPLLKRQLHPNAGRAALATEAARNQGKFWEYLALLYQNQNSLDDLHLLQFARQLGMDVEKFEADMNSVEVLARLQADIIDAQAAGVSATPTVVINGRVLEGAFSYEDYAQVIDQELSS